MSIESFRAISRADSLNVLSVLSRAKWPPAVVVLSLFLISYFSVWSVFELRSGSRVSAWAAMQLPAINKSFDDARLILEGVDCVKQGRDPYDATSKCDWRDRALNYPSIWLSLGRWLTVEQTDIVGISIGVIFAIALFLVFWRALPLAGLIGGMCAISPAVMLGVERGNTDLIIFSLLVMTSVLSIRFQRIADMVVATGILIAAALKLYPIATIVSLLRPCKRTLLFAGLATILFTCWLYYFRADLPLVSINTPQYAWKSFGYKTFFITLTRLPERDDALLYYPVKLSFAMNVIAGFTLFLAGIMSVVFGWRARKLLNIDLNFRYRTQAQFLIGSSIYEGTFALGTNFHYRLVFLILCIPLLAEWTIDRHVSPFFRSLALALTVGIVAICWFSAASGSPLSDLSIFFRFANDITSWCLFIGFGAILTNHLMNQANLFGWINAKS